jgi:hypothetical protein
MKNTVGHDAFFLSRRTKATLMILLQIVFTTLCKNLFLFLESLIDIIASIKLTILKRYHDDQLGSNSSPINRSFEAALDQLIADKYSMHPILKHIQNIYYYHLIGKPVAGNADGYVEAKINAMECLYSQTST